MANYRLELRIGNKTVSTQILSPGEAKIRGISTFDYLKYLAVKILMLLVDARGGDAVRIRVGDLVIYLEKVAKQLDGEFKCFGYTSRQVRHAVASVLRELGIARWRGRVIKTLEIEVSLSALQKYIRRFEKS